MDHKKFIRALSITTIIATQMTFVSTAKAADETSGFEIEEIIVTANRREQSLDKVPLSIAAFSKAKMDKQGIRSIDDIAVLTPGLSFSRASQFTGSNTNIAIRGIASGVGAATTGIYIDDMPIQTRSVGFSTANTYPRVFDLERIEVLRGPQGTLFGAGSEGGAVRFITTQPDLNDYSVYGRSEISSTKGGAANYELGVAVGGPIVEDVLGFRVSAWYRKDGGYVDRADMTTGEVIDENANNHKTTALRAALTWMPTEDVTITPSIFVQKERIDDTSAYWEGLSNPDAGVFKTGYVQSQPIKDDFIMPSLEVKIDFDDVEFVSVTSYFKRDSYQNRDYTAFDAALWYLSPMFDGQIATGFLNDHQKIFTQEFRLQSESLDGDLNWVVGVFYSRDKQKATQQNQDSFYDEIVEFFYAIPEVSIGYLPGDYLYDSTTTSDTKQKAIFGQFDYKMTEELTLTVGARFSKIDFDHFQDLKGPWAGGTPDPSIGSRSENSFTPKVGLSYQIDDDHMIYTSVSKGFRPGGAQTEVPYDLCKADLDTLGITTSPNSYESDSTWSYEVGTKNTFAEGRVKLDASVYYIKWSNVQTFVDLESCGSGFIGNLGSITSRGLDLNGQFYLTDDLSLNVAAGYTKATFDETINGGDGIIFVQKGDSALIGSGFTLTVSGNYDFEIADNPAFVRFDYSFNNAVEEDNPVVFGYVAENRNVPKTSLLNMRTGVKFDNIELSLFVNNMLDKSPNLGRLKILSGASYLTSSTFRPRTVGLTGTYRF